MDVAWYLGVVVNPGDGRVAWRVDAFKAYYGQRECAGSLGNGLVQQCCKGVGGIHYHPDAVLGAKVHHCCLIECAVYAHTMLQRDVLLAGLCAVEVGRTPFFQHLHGFASLCCSTKYQYHALPFRNR